MSESSSLEHSLTDTSKADQDSTLEENVTSKYSNSRRFLGRRKYESIDEEEDEETSSEEKSQKSSSIQKVSETSNSKILPTDDKPVKLTTNLEEDDITISEDISLLDEDVNFIIDLKEKVTGEEYSNISYNSSEDNDNDDSASIDTENGEPTIKAYDTIADALDSYVDDDTPSIKMPEYFTKLLCAVLDETIDLLDVLGCREKPTSQIIKDTFGSLDERLKDYSPDDPIIDTETAVSYRQILKEKEVNKIIEDGSLIKECLVYVKDKIQKTNSYKVLTKINEVLDRKEREEDELIAKERNNSTVMQTLERNIQTEDVESRRKLQELDENIAELRDKIENKFMENMLRERYCANWAKSIIEQRALKCKEKEDGLIDMKIKYDSIIEKEIKANSEIEWYYDEKYKKMEKSHEEWQKRYEKDDETLRAEIQVLEEQREEQQKELQKIKEDYERMKKEIDEYRAYKEKRRKEKERLDMLNAKASKIQAWWRGMMVRHKLGPYNPKKGKKGKKGKGKDKKTGKKK